MVSRSGAQEHIQSLKSCLPSPRLTYSHQLQAQQHAGRIEKQLQRDGHQTWGFVIYRTCYDSDEDWKEFLRRLWMHTLEEIQWRCDGADILDSCTWTIVDDPSLDGADSHEVRRRFFDWRAQAVTEEQGGQGDDTVKAPGASPRYRCAIQVNKESLRAVFHEALPPGEPDPDTKAWVRLIDAGWELGTAESLCADLGDGRVLSIGLACSDDLKEHPPIDGVTTRLVGWMKVRYQDIQGGIYADAADPKWWVRVYCRTPKVLKRQEEGTRSSKPGYVRVCNERKRQCSRLLGDDMQTVKILNARPLALSLPISDTDE